MKLEILSKDLKMLLMSMLTNSSVPNKKIGRVAPFHKLGLVSWLALELRLYEEHIGKRDISIGMILICLYSAFFILSIYRIEETLELADNSVKLQVLYILDLSLVGVFTYISMLA